MKLYANLFPDTRIKVHHGISGGGGPLVWPFDDEKIDDIPNPDDICPIELAITTAHLQI
jgi:hypothetical protein